MQDFMYNSVHIYTYIYQTVLFIYNTYKYGNLQERFHIKSDVSKAPVNKQNEN